MSSSTEQIRIQVTADNLEQSLRVRLSQVDPSSPLRTLDGQPLDGLFYFTITADAGSSGPGKLRLFADSDKAEQLQFVLETAGDITIEQSELETQQAFESGHYRYPLKSQQTAQIHRLGEFKRLGVVGLESIDLIASTDDQSVSAELEPRWLAIWSDDDRQCSGGSHGHFAATRRRRLAAADR